DGGASAEELELPGGAPGSAGGCSRAGPSAVGGGGLEVREGDAEEADGLSDPGAGPELEGHFTQQRAVRGDVAEGLVAAEQRVVGFAQPARPRRVAPASPSELDLEGHGATDEAGAPGSPRDGL